MITFTVFGIPKPKGSLKPFTYQKEGKTKVAMSRDKKHVDWENLVRNEAQRHAQNGYSTNPLRIKLEFYLTKPKSRIRKYSNPYPYPSTRPDLDKLVRSILDSLTGVLFKDDSQVCEIEAFKMYVADPDNPPRVNVYLAKLK